jgi:acetylornithine deacetylase/succinyl-diaminopimelate desuccinylase family protein
VRGSDVSRPPLAVDPLLITGLAEELISIPSVNPSLVPGAPGEGEVARCLAAACRRLGMAVTLEEVAPGRPNVVAVIRGADPARGRSLLLNGHTDTVGAAGMTAPFTPSRRGDRLFGRGSVDMKASLAAMIGAAAALRDAGCAPRGDLLLTFVADEEHLSAGTAAIAATRRADAAIVTEATGLRICVAHKGFVWATIRTEGRAAHGSEYEIGVDAIGHMGRVLAAVERLDREVLARRTHPLLGRPSVHASVIRGGEGLSTYPPSCDLVLERRTLPGETEGEVRAELHEMLASLGRDDPLFRASLEVTCVRPGLEVDRGTEIVLALHRACEGVRGSAPAYVGQGAWYDAALLAREGIPTVIFGPSGAGAHGEVEYVDLPSVVTCAEVLAQVIAGFCGIACGS